MDLSAWEILGYGRLRWLDRSLWEEGWRNRSENAVFIQLYVHHRLVGNRLQLLLRAVNARWVEDWMPGVWDTWLIIIFGSYDELMARSTVDSFWRLI